MEFRIADTFTDSLARLADQDQKAVKTTAFDLQVNPASPGMQFHKLAKGRDPNFWSIRVSKDIRLIVHRTDASLMLCYVGHHDDAYRWAERRKLETHPKTRAAQFVEVRETVREIAVPKYVEVPQPSPPKPPLFADTPDDDLLAYGVPVEWLDDVRQANEDSILEVASHLPSEAAEALLDLATGVTPQVAIPVAADADPFEHPDARRRFRVMANVEELQMALDYPWEKWAVFLHPVQRSLVDRAYGGPARVAGSAGTGKTVVALHRAVFLARRHEDVRVLLTTFSQPLADMLRNKLRQLVGNEPRVFERIEVHSIFNVGVRLYGKCLARPRLADDETIRQLLADAARDVGPHRFSGHFLWTEWSEVVDAWQLDSWDAYRDVARLGRKTRLGEKQRQLLWEVFQQVRSELSQRGMLTVAAVFTRLAKHLTESDTRPYAFAVVDEAQDISVPQLRFLAALAGNCEDGLFLAGDLGQRIFQTPFSWKSLGVDVRGRSFTLRINYRTSHQIRRQTDCLLPPELADVDGNTEDRRGVVSVFNGPAPSVRVCQNVADETKAVAEWLKNLRGQHVQPHEIAVFVRSSDQIDRARQAVMASGLEAAELDKDMQAVAGSVSVGTMHVAKGMEFRAVAVMACDDGILPLQERIEAVSDDADLEDVYNTERHLLYVACTRARDHLMVSGIDPASEFLDDLQS